jgi:hypothetical protein
MRPVRWRLRLRVEALRRLRWLRLWRRLLLVYRTLPRLLDASTFPLRQLTQVVMAGRSLTRPDLCRLFWA